MRAGRGRSAKLRPKGEGKQKQKSCGWSFPQAKELFLGPDWAD